MKKLFRVESQSAGEGLTPPGPWRDTGSHADTLEDAELLAKKEDAKGWRHVRIVADPDVADAQRAELERYEKDRREALDAEIDRLRDENTRLRRGLETFTDLGGECQYSREECLCCEYAHDVARQALATALDPERLPDGR